MDPGADPGGPKHTNPTEPDPDADPQHCILGCVVSSFLFSSLNFSYNLNKSFLESSVGGLDSRFYDQNLKYFCLDKLY
jgi:hypothetical protein